MIVFWYEPPQVSPFELLWCYRLIAARINARLLWEVR